MKQNEDFISNNDSYSLNLNLYNIYSTKDEGFCASKEEINILHIKDRSDNSIALKLSNEDYYVFREVLDYNNSYISLCVKDKSLKYDFVCSNLIKKGNSILSLNTLILYPDDMDVFKGIYTCYYFRIPCSYYCR